MVILAAAVTWRGHQHLARAVACLLAVALSILATRSADKRLSRTVFVLVVLYASAVLGWLVLRPLAALPSGRSVQVWSMFHYYLGPKYFPELGYTELYDQALAADRRGPRRFAFIRRTRDLSSYRLKRVKRLQLNSRWSEGRLKAFQADLAALRPYANRRTWRRIFIDRGYNAPPTATALRRLYGLAPPTPFNLALLGSLDTLLLFGALLWVGRVFGTTRALLCACWIALFFGNSPQRLVGLPVLYDYLAALLMCACALKRGHYLGAGAWLAYSTIMRIFPGFLMIGATWWAALHWWRNRRLPRDAVRFALGFAGVLILLAAVGLANGRGVEGWTAFFSNIGRHAEHHQTGVHRIGTRHLASVDWKQPLTGQPQRKRRQAFSDHRLAAIVASALITVLWIWMVAAARLQLWEAVTSSLVLVFGCLILSRYYASAAALFLLLGHARDGSRAACGSHWAAVAMFGWCGLYELTAMIAKHDLVSYVVANGLLTAGIVVTLLVFALGKSSPRALSHRQAPS